MYGYNLHTHNNTNNLNKINNDVIINIGNPIPQFIVNDNEEEIIYINSPKHYKRNFSNKFNTFCTYIKNIVHSTYKKITGFFNNLFN